MPVYEDWESALELCRNVDCVFRTGGSQRVRVLLVDDGSTKSNQPQQLSFAPAALDGISVLSLRRNLGHQRAIAVALAYIQQHGTADAIVVMDADGEDKPEDIPKLLAAMADSYSCVSVFARRGRRFETFSFRAFYQLYRIVHRVVTGRDIRFGNFSVLPWAHLETLVVFPELWNHYAATFLKSRLPYVEVRSDRGTRLAGKSKMNFVSLVIHGLSALFANQEVVGTRLLVLNILLIVMLFLGIGAVVGVKLLTQLAIPGWATTTMGLLLVLLAQSLVASIVLVFSTMMNRSQLGFLPIRDYCYFVQCETNLYPQ
jgi:polyisoprenyl-phosphate glycosyltransferase